MTSPPDRDPQLTPLPTASWSDAVDLGPPTSAPAQIGIWYEYTTAHCGVYSPIDFDRHYWLPLAATSDPSAEMVNSTSGTIRLIDAGTTEWMSESGVTVRLARLDENTWPWMCE